MYTDGASLTRTEEAVERLREALLCGTLPCSEGLTERAVGAFLGMSRTPVRAALQTLASEGLLSYEPQRGYRPRPVTRQSVLDAYKVRAALEGLACRELAERGLSVATRETLEGCVALGRTLLAEGAASFRHDAWRRMNGRFHSVIVEEVGNASLLGALRHVERLPLASFNVIATVGARPDFLLLDGAQRDHEQIVTYLAAGMSSRAGDRMHEHILVAGDLLTRAMPA